MACHPVGNQLWNIIDWTDGNNLKFESILYILLRENALENAVCEISPILSRPQYVNIQSRELQTVNKVHDQQPR